MSNSPKPISKIGAAHGGGIPGILLWQASKLWQRQLNVNLSDLGLSSTNATILTNILYFDENGLTATQADIAMSAKVDVMTTSRVIRALEKKLLIRRQENPQDSRAYTIVLTTTGRETARKAIKQIVAAHQTFFKTLETSGDRAAFVNELDNLVTANDSKYN